MIYIKCYENEIAGKVFVVTEDDSERVTIWRIAGSSCNGGCRENREVSTFKTLEGYSGYATKLGISKACLVNYTSIDDAIAKVTNDMVELESGEVLFEGLATTFISPVYLDSLVVA